MPTKVRYYLRHPQDYIQKIKGSSWNFYGSGPGWSTMESFTADDFLRLFSNCKQIPDLYVLLEGVPL